MKIIVSLSKKKNPKWSAKVHSKWHPPEGFFSQPAAKLAAGLKKASKDHAQAVNRLNFYRNRAGRNLSRADHKRLDAALTILQGLYK